MNTVNTVMDWTQIALQLPIVAAFIWYSLEMQKRFQESMDKRDNAYLEALNKVTEKLDIHDRRVEEALARPTRRVSK
jgi:hypothetical protein